MLAIDTTKKLLIMIPLFLPSLKATIGPAPRSYQPARGRFYLVSGDLPSGDDPAVKSSRPSGNVTALALATGPPFLARAPSTTTSVPAFTESFFHPDRSSPLGGTNSK